MALPRLLGLSCLAVCLCLAPAYSPMAVAGAAASVSGASVSGTFTANGETVELPYVYVYALDKGFYDDEDPTWTLLFVDRPIEERKVDEPVWDAAFIELGVTRTAEFDEEPRLQVYSQSLRFSADQAGNVSGGTYPEIELESTGPERFTGRVYLSEEQEVFDDTFQYDLTFSAPLSDPDAPIGDPLPEGGGDPGKAHLAWVNAIHSGDIEQLKALVPAELASQLDGEEAQEQIDFLRAMTPIDQKVLSGSSDGKTAVLKVEGVMDGETVRGEVTLERIDGVWTATTASW